MVPRTIQFLCCQHFHTPDHRIMIGCHCYSSWTLATPVFGMPWNCLRHKYHFELSHTLWVLKAVLLKCLSCLWVAQLLACEMRLHWRWQRTWRSTPHHWCMPAKSCVCETCFWSKGRSRSCVCSKSVLEGDATHTSVANSDQKWCWQQTLLGLCRSPCRRHHLHRQRD